MKVLFSGVSEKNNPQTNENKTFNSSKAIFKKKNSGFSIKQLAFKSVLEID